MLGLDVTGGHLPSTVGCIGYLAHLTFTRKRFEARSPLGQVFHRRQVPGILLTFDLRQSEGLDAPVLLQDAHQGPAGDAAVLALVADEQTATSDPD